MDRKRQKLSPEKNDVQKECQDAKITALERKLLLAETDLKLVTGELEQVKEENSQLKSKIDKNREQWTELLYENEGLQKRLQDLETANINVEEKSQITLCNSDLTSQIMKVTGELEQVKEENSQLKSKIDKNREQWTELLYENEGLQKRLQDLETANINVEEKSQITLCNSDLTSQIMKIEESNDEALGINVLPNEIILKIFGYVEQNQLGQIARVCSRWNMLTRSPALWKKVDVKFHCSHKSHNTMTRCFINMLPSCVTSIRLHYSNLDWTEELNFEEICVRLQRRCPHLEMLILEHVNLSDNFPSVIGLCNQFLPGVKILVFRHSTFSDCSTRGKFGGLSKIEVLDVSDCNVGPFQELQFSNMPQLRVLNLGNSWIGSPAFLSLQKHGLNLEELYLCGAVVLEDDLIFSNSIFPLLKIICLCCRFYIFNSVVSAIQSCQSLQKIYIHENYVRLNLISHPFFENNRCKFKIIETIAEHHSHNVDYSYETNKI